MPSAQIPSLKKNMMSWLKEPLLHFLALGAIIFGVYIQLNPAGPSDSEIVVSQGQQEHLVSAFTRAWNRPPTQQEFIGIVDDWIREEIAYREGLDMGLDTNDTIIRRRLRQKLEVLADDIVSMAPPTREELAEYLARNPENYTLEPAYTLQHVFFSIDRRGAAAEQDAKQALLLLQTDSRLTNPNALGDPISLPARFVSERASNLDATFGVDFAQTLNALDAGQWEGPVRSGYGLHLVLIEEKNPGRPLTFQEAEADVRRDWENERRVETIERLYQRLRESYTITVEPWTRAEISGS